VNRGGSYGPALVNQGCFIEQPRKGADSYLVDPTVSWITIEYQETNKNSQQQTFMLSPPIPRTGPRKRLRKFRPDGLSD
jgi:hypothetical protein